VLARRAAACRLFFLPSRVVVAIFFVIFHAAPTPRARTRLPHLAPHLRACTPCPAHARALRAAAPRCALARAHAARRHAKLQSQSPARQRGAAGKLSRLIRLALPDDNDAGCSVAAGTRAGARDYTGGFGVRTRPRPAGGFSTTYLGSVLA